MKNKFCALALTLVFLLSLTCPAAAAEEIGILINDTFNEYVTNDTPTDFTYSGVKAKVVEVAPDNKALLVESGVRAQMSKSAGEFGDYFVVSVDVKYEGEPASFSIGLGSSQAPAVPVKIENALVKTWDGKRLGSISERAFTTIALVVSKAQRYSVYIDGKRKISDWKMPSGGQTGELIFQITNTYGEESKLYFDNIRMYQSKRVLSCLPTAGMNPQRVDRLDVDDDAGDYLYFDSYDMNTSKRTYENFTAVPKTNELVCGRYDYTNPNRDESIYLKKTTTDDCFFDIAINKHSYMRSSKTYSYFLVEGDFKSVDATANAAYQIRDNTSGQNQDTTLLTLQPKGGLRTADGRVISGAVKNGQWFHLQIGIDLADHMADIYVDGSLVAGDVPINANLNTLRMFRFGFAIGEGSGEIYVKDFRLTGLVVPFENGVETKTSLFPDEGNIEDYLQDKIAFHGYGQLLTVNGEKTKIDPEPILEEDELYVAAPTLGKAFGLTLQENGQSISGEGITIDSSGAVTYAGEEFTLSKAPKEQEGRLFVPVLAFGSEVMGKHTFHHETGIFLLADEEIFLETGDWQYVCMRPFSGGITVMSDFDQLNSYLSFERPSAQQIQEDFNRVTNDGQMHPRILITGDQFDQIKENRATDPQLDQLVSRLLEKAENWSTKEVLTYKYDDAMRMLNTAREAMNRMEIFGFAWQITGDEKWGQLAWRDLEALSKFPDFNTSHIIDSGEFNMALAVGYDWFYDYLSDEQKKVVSDTILNKSLKDLADVYYGRIASTSSGSQVSISAKWTSNYNTIVNGGVINAALAVAELDPEYCFDVIEKAVRSIEYTTYGFAPGGGWSEGAGYWNYTWHYFTNAMASLKACTGTDYSVLDYQGVRESLYYHIALCGPQGMNNYHDAGESTTYSTDMNYGPLASFFDQPEAFALRRNHLIQTQATPEVFDVIFYQFDVPQSAMDSLPLAIKTTGTESFSFRQTYDWTAGGMYASAHFGATSGYHTQNDTGTFVYDVLGKRWAMDLGSEDYNLTNELGIPLWQTYRRRAEGHNICVINPGEQYNQIEGKFSPITTFESNEYGGFAIADMDGIYADADHMKSGYYVGDDMRSLTVRHEIDLNKPSTIYWFMHTRADVTIGEGNEVILSQGNDSVNLRYATNAENVEVSVMDAKPLPTSPNPPEQNQNEGVRKVAIKMEASGHLDLTVKLAPMGEPASITPLLDIPMEQWELPQKSEYPSAPNLNFTILSDGMEVTGPLPCYEGEEMPQLQVVTEDPSAVVEITPATSPEETTTVRVSDSTGGYYKIGKVEYVEVSGKSLNEFDQLPISSVEVSSEPEPVNHKANMLDGSMATRWTCMAEGEWAVFDLGEEKEIDGVAIAFWKGNVRQYFFDILVSQDGVNFESVYADGASSGTTESLEVYDFEKVNARYVKFIGYGNSEVSASGVNSNILEFRVLKNRYE